MTETPTELPDEQETEAGPLTGITVLDFTRVLAGPHCTRMLADLGADVIKLEPPVGGDVSRTFGLRIDHMSLYFLQQNVGKRNISLDLTTARGVEVARALAMKADVLVENFRPGVMEALGLDYATMAALNPRLVYASISGFGQRGPWRHRKAYAPVIHAESGLTDMRLRRDGGEQPFEAIAHADTYTALEAFSGILAALYQRTRTMRGQHVDVSMAATMLSVNDRAAVELRAEDPGKFDVVGTVAVRMADGRSAVIAGDPTNTTVFRDYCHVMNREELVVDPRFSDRKSRRDNLSDLLAILQEWVLTFPDLTSLEAVLSRIHLPVGVVRSVKEIAATGWADEWGAFVSVSDRQGGTAEVPQSPWRFSGAVTGVRGSAAFPGEHNRVVLQEVLGFSADEVAELEEAGVVRSRLPTNLVAEAIPSDGRTKR